MAEQFFAVLANMLGDATPHTGAARRHTGFVETPVLISPEQLHGLWHFESRQNYASFFVYFVGLFLFRAGVMKSHF
jgi:hypothetical protein